MDRLRGILAATFMLVLVSSSANAMCKARFINLIQDIAWGAAFPVRIGAMLSFGGADPDPLPPSAATTPLCTCPGPAGIPVPGITVSFWEPVYIFESVHDAFCYPSMGIEMDGVTGASRLNGTMQTPTGKSGSSAYFAQAHFIKFPAWAALDLFTDIPCIADGDIDIGYMTELDPMWQNDLQSLVLNPEALVFGNIALQMSCMADATATIADIPVDALFWCMGQWGGTYPFAGMSNTSNPVIGAASASSRLLYKMHRELLVCDANINACGCTRTPIWHKSNWKLQIVRPKVNYKTIRIGEPSPLWETGQYNALRTGDDNFAYIVWRRVTCCATYNPF